MNYVARIGSDRFPALVLQIHWTVAVAVAELSTSITYLLTYYPVIEIDSPNGQDILVNLLNRGVETRDHQKRSIKLNVASFSRLFAEFYHQSAAELNCWQSFRVQSRNSAGFA